MATQQVLVTGPFGEAGKAILNHLAECDEYEFTYPDWIEHPEYETFTAGVADYEATRPAFDGQDTIIHLVVQSDAGVAFEDITEPSIMGTYNVPEAMGDTDVKKLIYASSQHVMGLYEENLTSDLCEKNYPSKYDPLRFTRETLSKPDSYCDTSKMFDEYICRTHARHGDAPGQVCSIRISSVRTEQYDHPYGDVERDADRGDGHKVEDGEVWDQSQTDSWKRKSDEYEKVVKRLKATWTSQRDFAYLLECRLGDGSATYGTFYAVSGNKACWFDTNHARAVLDYEPADDGSEWDSPPE